MAHEMGVLVFILDLLHKIKILFVGRPIACEMGCVNLCTCPRV